MRTVHGSTDADLGKPSSTQTEQHFGKLTAKGGVSPDRKYRTVLCAFRRAFMRSLPKRWISPPLKPLLNCLLRGMACLKQLVSAMEVHITSKEHFHTGKCNTFQFEAEEVGRPHKETLKERQYLARCFRA